MAQNAPSIASAELAFADLVGTLRAVAEPTRLRLVALLSRDGADRHRDHPGHRPEPAARQPPPAAAGRRRGARARARGGLRLLPPCRRSAAEPVWRGIWPSCCRRLMRPSPPTSPRSSASARRGRRRPPPTATPTPTSSRALQDLYVPEAEVERVDARDARRRGPDRPAARHRHRHRADPRAACAAQRAQRRTRPRSRHAAAGARGARRGPAVAGVGPPRRPAPAAVRGSELRRRGDAPRAAPARRSRRRRSIDAARLLRPGGRLLVADFASHGLEHLRELHGHRHLGIADREMQIGPSAAGLEIETERSLPPARPGRAADRAPVAAARPLGWPSEHEQGEIADVIRLV